MALGFLFDLDGTMADTDVVHFETFNILLAEFGRAVTLDTYKARMMGGANARIMQELFPEFEAQRHAELADRKEALFRSRSEHLQPLAGLLDLLAEAARHAVPVGVVTNAPRANAEHMLRVLGLGQLLASVVVGEEIARSKPDPLPYLIGLARLGCPAGRAIAFEDSHAGVTAASAAGIYTVGIETSLGAADLLAAGADMTIRDYDDAGLRALVRAAIEGGAICRRKVRPPDRAAG